ncbi:NUDIX domain-containing protein [Pannonibacter sp. Pt2-lr]
MPGGTLDPGESHLIGARREFFEETGLTLDGALDHLADQDHVFDNGRGATCTSAAIFTPRCR